VTCIMLPVFLTALGDEADLTFFPTTIKSRINGNDSSTIFVKFFRKWFVLIVHF